MTPTKPAYMPADISFSVGITGDGTLNGYSITAISETPGLGVLVQEEPFYSQFEGKAEETYTANCTIVTRDATTTM